MAPEGLYQHSQGHNTGPYNEPTEFGSQPLILFLKDPF